MPVPSITSTMSIEGASFSMALASSMVRFGRRRSSENSTPLEMLRMLILLTKIVLGPSARTWSRSDSSKPRMSDVIPTIAVMPITTPRMVNADRSLLVRRVSSAILTTSPASDLFTAQRLDGIKARGTRCRVEAEEESHAGRDAQAQDHGPRLEARRERRHRRNRQGGDRSQGQADYAAEQRQRDRLGEHLRHDVGLARA